MLVCPRGRVFQQFQKVFQTDFVCQPSRSTRSMSTKTCLLLISSTRYTWMEPVWSPDCPEGTGALLRPVLLRRPWLRVHGLFNPAIPRIPAIRATGFNNVLLVKIGLGRWLVNPIYHHRNLLLKGFLQAPLLINQPMGKGHLWFMKGRTAFPLQPWPKKIHSKEQLAGAQTPKSEVNMLEISMVK